MLSSDHEPWLWPVVAELQSGVAHVAAHKSKNASKFLFSFEINEAPRES